MFKPYLRFGMWYSVHNPRRASAVMFGIAASIALAGCVTSTPLPEAKGKFRPINTGRWSPMPEDLKGPEKARLAPAPKSAR